MKTDEFQRLTVQHGGLTGVSVVDPHVETETPSDDPNAPPIKSRQPNPTPKYKYVFADGTEMTALTSPDGTIQVTDPGTALKPPATTAATQAETERHNRAVEAETAKRNAQAAANQAGQSGLANRRENRLITADEAKQRYDQIAAERRADIDERRVSVEEANAKASRARDELDAEIKRAQQARDIAKAKQDEEKARFDQEKFAKEQSLEREKEAARVREANRKFAYDAGQDAVANATKLLPYTVAQSFGPSLAGVFNAAMGGGGAPFAPGAFSFPLPDLQGIADREVARSMALFNAPVTTGPGAPPAAPTPAGATPAGPTAGTAGAAAATKLGAAQAAGTLAPPPSSGTGGAVAPPATNPAVAAALATVPVAKPAPLVAAPATRDQWGAPAPADAVPAPINPVNAPATPEEQYDAIWGHGSPYGPSVTPEDLASGRTYQGSTENWPQTNESSLVDYVVVPGVPYPVPKKVADEQYGFKG